MNNYTQGEWKVTHEDNIMYGESFWVVCDGSTIAEIKDWGAYREKDNAQLIASAPDLYEALTLTRNNLQTLSDAALHYKRTFRANLKVLNQALAKAEG